MIGLAASVGCTARDDGDGNLIVHGLDAEQIGDLAFEHEIKLHELTPVNASLEQAFMDLTAASVDFRAGLPGGEDHGQEMGRGIRTADHAGKAA
jgi:ABC-2 type transport system ATP-binding protein